MKYTSQHGPCVVSIHVGRDVQLFILLSYLHPYMALHVKVFPVWCCVAIAVLVNQL